MAGDSITSEAPQVFQFSTDAFRKHERVSAWREAFGRTLLNIDIAPKSPEDFHASATMFRVADLGLIRASTSAADQCNSPSLITNDNVCFGGVMDAQWGAKQLGRSDCASMLEMTLKEEKAADKKLTMIAGSKLNPQAAA